MSPLRFLHGGDFHLDSLFHGLGPPQATKARGEQRSLLARFFSLAKREEVDLIFLTGDLFDRERVYPETLHSLRALLEETKIPTFLSPGNHDPYIEGSPYARLAWPPHVHIFRQEQVEAVPLPHLGCTVYGSAFTSSYRTDSPLNGLRLQGEGLHLGCFHGDLCQGPSRYGPIRREEIAASGLHYLALGHIHGRTELARAGDCYYAYPGCPQGRGFDEQGVKGVYLGEVKTTHVSLHFVPLSSRQYQDILLDISEKKAEEALRESLPLEPLPDMVRIILRGERDEEDVFSLSQLQRLASPFFFNVSFLDQTTLSRSLWARKWEENLSGLFLREMQQRLDTASPEERPRLELALRFGLAALDGKEAPE